MKLCKYSNLIQLSDEEIKIFNFLKDVKQYLNIDTEFRVTGGWVRDKLINSKSDDIDISLSNITGIEFTNNLKRYSKKEKILGKDYIVSINPEKSKYIETVAIELFGKKIDFVHLRSENYGSCDIPRVEIGTPESDAFKRDLTINSLFYNIENNEIEDYVGGIKDIYNKILKTPISAQKVFQDDPLRMLRVIRLKSQFPDFSVSSDIKSAMKQKDIQNLYSQKVSPYRVGPEIMKIMTGKDPEGALRILFETNLYEKVFELDKEENLNPDKIHMDQKTPWHKYNLMEHTLKVIKNLNILMRDLGESDEMRGLLNISALFHDFGKMKIDIATPHPKNPSQMQYIKHERVSVRMANDILKSIGIGKDKRDIISQIIKYHMIPHSILHYGNKGKAKFLRKTRLPGKEEKHKDLWKYIFYHAKADSMSSVPENYNEEDFQQHFNDFRNYVENPPTPQKLLINGDDILSISPYISPGAWISEILKEMQVKQDKGDFHTHEEAIDILKKIKSRYE